jgi:hypothetical protein
LSCKNETELVFLLEWGEICGKGRDVRVGMLGRIVGQIPGFVAFGFNTHHITGKRRTERGGGKREGGIDGGMDGGMDGGSMERNGGRLRGREMERTNCHMLYSCTTLYCRGTYAAQCCMIQ